MLYLMHCIASFTVMVAFNKHLLLMAIDDLEKMFLV